MKFRKGEVQLYKGHSPKELNKMSKKFPENKKYIEYFIENYQYNYVQKTWKKRGQNNV